METTETMTGTINNASAPFAEEKRLFFKRNEEAAIRTLYELEKAAGVKVEQTAESVLEHLSALVCVQKEEFGTRKCKYIPLAVMRSVWMVKTSGHGRELSEETTFSRESDTVTATVVLSDGFGETYKTSREKPVDRQGFDSDTAQILRSKDLVRGTAWSACYASVHANNGYSKVYVDDDASLTGGKEAEKEAIPSSILNISPKTDTLGEEAVAKKKPGRPRKKVGEAEPVPASTTDTAAEITADSADNTQKPEGTIQEAETRTDALSAATSEAPLYVEEAKPAAETESSAATKELEELPYVDGKTAPAVPGIEDKAETAVSQNTAWPTAPAYEMPYETALEVRSPFLKHKLKNLIGFNGSGTPQNAVIYIEKAMERHKPFDDEDVVAMMTIIEHNADLKQLYAERLLEENQKTA